MSTLPNDSKQLDQRNKEKTVILKDESLRQLGGWVQLPRVVLKDAKLSMGARLTYALLLSYAWQENFCFPAQKKLAEDLNTSDRHVRRFLQELKQRKLIDWKQVGLNRPNIYYILSLQTIYPATEVVHPDRTSVSTPDRTSVSHQDRTPASDKYNQRIESLNALTLTNVDNPEHSQKDPRNANAHKTSKQRLLEEAHNENDPGRFEQLNLAYDILETCQDEKSLTWYLKVVKSCPRPMIEAALSEVKDYKLTGKLRRSAGAAFTAIIREKAKRAGIPLAVKSGIDKDKRQ